MSYTTVTLCFRDIEFGVDVEGHVVRGGSNSYGSDEPEWVEIEGVAYTHPQRARPCPLVWSNGSKRIMMIM